MTTAQTHQKNIALRTLRMPDAMAGVMGGMTKQQAREFLKSINITVKEEKK